MIKKLLLGNRALQNFWRKLFKLAVKGMNYDRGHVPSANGEEFALQYSFQFFKRDDRIILFDVGANRGQYLTMASGIGEERLHVFCFEPQFSAFSRLKEVSSRFRKVIIENIGFGEQAATVTLYKNSESSEMASVYPANYTQYNVQLNIREEITLDTLDNYCHTHKIDRINFLKMDVEGHEVAVLKGAKRMIGSGKIDFIQFEFGLAAIESRTFLKDFFSILPDYIIYRILPNGLARIEYSEYAELFLTTNYLAVLKSLK
jgi:FkbM family methyltransferase